MEGKNYDIKHKKHFAAIGIVHITLMVVFSKSQYTHKKWKITEIFKIQKSLGFCSQAYALYQVFLHHFQQVCHT